jgi:hypothetical protein
MTYEKNGSQKSHTWTPLSHINAGELIRPVTNANSFNALTKVLKIMENIYLYREASCPAGPGAVTLELLNAFLTSLYLNSRSRLSFCASETKGSTSPGCLRKSSSVADGFKCLS